MKKTIRLTESDLVRLVKRVIKEQSDLKIEFDPTKKVEPTKEDDPKSLENEESFGKVKSSLVSFKKPSRDNFGTFNGRPYSHIDYTDKFYDTAKKVAIETYNLSIWNNGDVYFTYKTPEMKKIAEDNGFVPLEGDPNTLVLKWIEGDLASNIERIKTLLRNPKLRVSYDRFAV
jgi:hypothetical protein